MATTLALAMRASMSASGVVSGASDASRAMDRMGKQAKQTARDVSTLKNIAIGAVLAKGVSMAANAFMSASRAALSYAASAANAVDQTNDLAQRLGMSVESLQALQMAAKLSGVDDATGALQKLTVAIGNAAESGKTEAFTKLGLSFQSLQSMSPEEQFKAIQQAIASLKTPAEQAAAAVSIFGKAGVELLPLMNQNLAEVEQRMRRLGAIVGDDQVEAIGGMNDALDMVKATFDGIIANVAGNLAPVVESLANDLLAFMEEFNNVGGEGGGIADVISNALLDIADYFAGIFDNAVAQFEGFSVTMERVGSIFESVGNVFAAVGEALRAAFNVFQLAGDAMAAAMGTFLQYLGSYFSKDLQNFGKVMVSAAMESTEKNSRDLEDAASGVVKYANRAVFGGNDSQEAELGPARRAVRDARERMNPEARAEREAARKAKQAADKAAREAAAADAKARKDAEDARKRQEEAAKKADAIRSKADAIQVKIDDRQQDVGDITAERAAALGGKSNEALKANDLRSGEGMAQFLALASGREDPAIAEYRKQTQKLDEIRGELRALQQEKVDILGAAA
jgi:hypothetical protein